MKIIYMGTPDFAVGPLRALTAAGHRITGVVTQPDQPKGRGKAMRMPPVKEAALAYGIPVYQPVSVKDPAFVEMLRGLEADVIVVAAFGQLLPPEVLHMPRYGCLNIHASLLPRYRGAAPIQWAVLDGVETTGVTIMQMDEGLDTGDILLVKEVAVSPQETGGSLFEKMSGAGAGLIVEALKKLEAGGLKAVPQTGESSYAAMLTKAIGNIDWSRSAPEIERMIRGLNPWPGAYTHLDGKLVKLWAAVPEPDAEEKKVPGQICRVTRRDFSVQTGGGLLRITSLQPEGKKRMEADAFLRGYPLTEQMRFEE